MTDGVKGLRQPNRPPPSGAAERPRTEVAENQVRSSPQDEAAAIRSLEEAPDEVDQATEEIRELESRFSPPPPPPEARTPRSDSAAPPEPIRDARTEGVDQPSAAGMGGSEEIADADPPIRTPEEATRVAERVSRDIVANPTQALAVNINVAAVRALFS